MPKESAFLSKNNFFSTKKNTKIKAKENKLATNKESKRMLQHKSNILAIFNFYSKRQLTIFKSPPTKKTQDVPAHKQTFIMSAHLSQKKSAATKYC